MFVGCLLYADDMILLCPSIKGLQCMLDVTVRTAAMLSLKFNPIKSYCMAIGQLSRIKLEPMMLDSSNRMG